MRFLNKLLNRSNIRDKESLNEEQIRFIQGKSLGMVAPFYWLLRNMWAFVGLWIVTSVIMGVLGGIAMIFAPLSASSEIDSLLISLQVKIWVLVANLCAQLWLVYLSWHHCRRWSWNINNWSDFATFERSEDTWDPIGFGAAVIIVIISLTLLLG